MIGYLDESPFTFTAARLLGLLQGELTQRELGRRPWVFTYKRFNVHFSNLSREIDVQDTSTIIDLVPAKDTTELCSLYLPNLAAQNASLDITQLDEAHRRALTCEYTTEKISHATVVRHALSILTRLPATPPPFTGACEALVDLDLGADNFLPGGSADWPNLRAVRFVDSNVLRLALHIGSTAEYVGENHGFQWLGAHPKSLANYISIVFEATFGIYTRLEKRQLPTRRSFFVLLAFLWTSWHRVVMLFYHHTLGMHLRAGYDFGRNRVSSIDLTSLMRKLSTAHTMQATPQYMCNWAFLHVSKDRAAMPPDFRAFKHRFSKVFASHDARCIGNSSQCQGLGPANCMRFMGATILDQSVHGDPCQGGTTCHKLLWDEASFRNQLGGGGRAVSLEATDETHIRYHPAGLKTLAISHVWSHGQGGRPEENTHALNGGQKYSGGFNICLHARYKRVAESLGCDSYWMDTPCIPCDHELRREAIANINTVFSQAMATLVCDRDIMSIDASNLTLELQESILSVLLVCDWNVRAWTLLEAIRGRKNIHLLFKDDKTVRLMDILCAVYSAGDISIANLYLTAQHLIPAVQSATDTPSSTSTTAPDTRIRTVPGSIESNESNGLGSGLLSVQEAACLLSHRHASRQGDEVVIWSLLCSETPCYTAKDFWDACVQRAKNRSQLLLVPTGLLMSSVPRLQAKGLSWAPSRPNLPEECYTTSRPGSAIIAGDGAGTVIGIYQEAKLVAGWNVVRFDGGRRRALSLFTKTSSVLLPRVPGYWFGVTSGQRLSTARRLDRIAREYLPEYKFGALARPCPLTSDVLNGENLREYGQGGAVVAVLGTNDDREHPDRVAHGDARGVWTWVGVFKWDEDLAPLPTFKAQWLRIE
ncbi:hypothetical protein B0T24DRAFT_632681 [Lasiosphaeria ovina]|uniref:Heterokaryon incompatibility domain-containing protein n=1 Tax=Lasiosphaeria ovina TaxID=92902 RepID=A0AAE0K4J3_9PEZI|nr:hypothetical protein B0T24DRAFT_632681 [Lasiosphaeria ovina]